MSLPELEAALLKAETAAFADLGSSTSLRDHSGPQGQLLGQQKPRGSIPLSRGGSSTGTLPSVGARSSRPGGGSRVAGAVGQDKADPGLLKPLEPSSSVPELSRLLL